MRTLIACVPIEVIHQICNSSNLRIHHNNLLSQYRPGSRMHNNYIIQPHPQVIALVVQAQQLGASIMRITTI